MSVLDNERRSATRSALRYRPIDAIASNPGPLITRQRRSRPDTHVTSAPAPVDDLDLEEERHPLRKRRVALLPVPPESAAPVRSKQRLHPLLFVGAGLLLALLLWTGLTRLMEWGTSEYNTLVYGYPRTFQIDAVVGHGDSPQHPSHFVAINLHGSVSIIEFPGSDPSRAHVLVFASSPGSGADLAVVTLRFIDLNHHQKPDMLIDIGGVQSILINTGNTFRVPTPAEQQQILQILQQSV